MIHLSGHNQGDILYLGPLLLYSTSLKMTLHYQKNAFVLIRGKQNQDFKLDLLDVLFCIRKSSVNTTQRLTDSTTY